MLLWHVEPDPDPDQVLDLHDENVLSVYLNSLNSLPTAIGESSSLSTAAVAGIIIAAIVLVLCVLVIVTVIIYFCNRYKQSSSL